MFRERTNTRLHGSEPIQILAVAPRTKKPSSWRPALKRLFSRKKPVSEAEKQEQLADYTAISQPEQQQVEVPKSVPSERPRNKDDDTVRANASSRAPVSEVTKYIRDSRQRSFVQTIIKKKYNKELQDPKLRNYYASRENENVGLLRQYREVHLYAPGTVACISKHAATDLHKTTIRQPHAERDQQVATPIMQIWRPPPTKIPAPDRPQSTCANTPMSIQSSKCPTTPPLPTRALTPIPDPATVAAAADQETDFQFFLRESRIAVAHDRGPEDFLSPTPRKRPLSGAVMDNIMANRHSTLIAQTPTGSSNIQRANSTTSKKAAATKAAKEANRRSIIGSVGEYIKPAQNTRPNTNRYSVASVFERDSMNGSIYKSGGGVSAGGGRRKEIRKRWSIGGPLKKSLSRDRDNESDERIRASKALAMKKEKRRSMQAPVGNPALETYNQGVMVGRGGRFG